MTEEVVAGPSGLVRFDAARCIHAWHCVIDRPDVFVPNVEGEWIHPDRATPAALLELAHNCPSGAIRCEHADGRAMESAPQVNTVRLRENRPLAFRAPLSVDGSPQGFRLTLCAAGPRTTSRTATAAMPAWVSSPAAR